LAVFELLERLHRTQWLTSLIATHNLKLAERCDRILGLETRRSETRKAATLASGPGSWTAAATGKRANVFERYTEKARRVIFCAATSESVRQSYIETETLLLGLMREDKALANRFCGSKARLSRFANRSKRASRFANASRRRRVPLSAKCKRILNMAAEEANARRQACRNEHLLLES